MNVLSAFCHSSIGKKTIVAITGIILILFVIGHLLGNLQIFLGPEWINGYSQHLRDLGPLLWLIRAFLLFTVILHIYFTIQLALENRRARPPYPARVGSGEIGRGDQSIDGAGAALIGP